jgi:hypothetical protein
MFIALLGSHFVPFHLRNKGCTVTPMSRKLMVKTMRGINGSYL